MKFLLGGAKFNIFEYELASQEAPKRAEISQIGTRVIAQRRSKYLPGILDENFKKHPLFFDPNNGFYPGIIASMHHGNRALIFFDDGVVQYIELNSIRRVLGNDKSKHGTLNS